MPHKVRALVVIEPSQGGLSDRAAALTTVPILAVFGDHFHTGERPASVRALAMDFLKTVEALGGSVELLDLPSVGIMGNSHLLMLELNNREIAERIEQWLVAKAV